MNNTSEARIFGLLGLARRGGRLTAGFDAAATSLSTGRAALLLTACDLSPKTLKELRFLMERNGSDIPLVPLSADKKTLAASLGYGKPVGILAVEDRGFARSLQKLVSDSPTVQSANERRDA